MKRFFQQNAEFNWLSFFRRSVSLFLILHFISISPDFNALYSLEGIFSLKTEEIVSPKHVIGLKVIATTLEKVGLQSQIFFLLFKCIYILCALLIFIGFKYRIVSLLLLVLQISMVQSNPLFSYGVDYFSSMSIFYLIVIPSNINSPGFYIMQKFFQIHLSIVYFFGGLNKIIGENWWNGESLWKAINLPFSSSVFSMNFLSSYPKLIIIAGVIVCIIELTYPFVIWFKKIAYFWVYAMILIHISIAIFLNLYYFSIIMIIWNLTLLISTRSALLNEINF